MGSWIALVGSFVIGGMVLLRVWQFHHDFSRDQYLDTIEHIAYSNLDEVVRLIEYDFSRIGLGINDPKQSILTLADSTDLRFYLDADGNGTLETLRYYLSDTIAAAITDNPRDRILYRVVNGGTPERISTGLTGFMIKYYDAAGNKSSDLQKIKTFIVRLEMESDIIYDGRYPRLIWEGKITPPNLVTH
jgi:hypothetical protein